ncbi:hypothetical protein ACHHYP_13995 [Achlya hypogyna]|uniref:Uncharacterized protein n=1 Tax=Achlya hypogyna TaxID=1202772 RepID=A0A1V9YE66_ACHHY|nr:hypothetical protein ACHHYP_13995 [Achlya hypogyna]
MAASRREAVTLKSKWNKEYITAEGKHVVVIGTDCSTFINVDKSITNLVTGGEGPRAIIYNSTIVSSYTSKLPVLGLSSISKSSNPAGGLCAPWENIIQAEPGSLLTQNGLSREPDVVVSPNPSGDAADKGPRMVVEFDHKGLSFPQAKDWIKGYFTMLPSLRTAIAFKIFGPLGGDRYAFGPVVLVYRREPDDPVHNVPGPPVLVYGASIGTAPLSSQSQRDMTPEDLAFFEANAFHDDIAAEIALGHFEWAAATPRPVIPLLVEDLFYADTHNLLAGAPPHAQNLQIDIFKVVYRARCRM